jgi:hypothetical protein
MCVCVCVVYMYVCMYVYIYICVCVYIYISGLNFAPLGAETMNGTQIWSAQSRTILYFKSLYPQDMPLDVLLVPCFEYSETRGHFDIRYVQCYI